MKTVLALAFVTLSVSSALAQKPTKQPFVYERDFGAGEVCAFPLRILADGKQYLQFPSGREMFAGQTTATLTNLATGTSIEVKQYGRSAQTLLEDGTYKLETSGQILFFLLPQDMGGPALTLATGHTVMIYDLDLDAVTSLRPAARTLDVCAALGE